MRTKEINILFFFSSFMPFDEDEIRAETLVALRDEGVWSIHDDDELAELVQHEGQIVTDLTIKMDIAQPKLLSKIAPYVKRLFSLSRG